MWHIWETEEVLVRRTEGKRQLARLGVDGTIIIKWTGLIWLRTGARGRLLRKRYLTFGFLKIG